LCTFQDVTLCKLWLKKDKWFPLYLSIKFRTIHVSKMLDQVIEINENLHPFEQKISINANMWVFSFEIVVTNERNKYYNILKAIVAMQPYKIINYCSNEPHCKGGKMVSFVRYSLHIHITITKIASIAHERTQYPLVHRLMIHWCTMNIKQVCSYYKTCVVTWNLSLQSSNLMWGTNVNSIGKCNYFLK
jgi:hypothetical protein